MSIAKKIVYKGQCIEVIFEKSQGRILIISTVLSISQKEHDGSCAWRMLQCQTKFPQRDEAIKEAKIRIVTEFKNVNWVEPTQDYAQRINELK